MIINYVEEVFDSNVLSNPDSVLDSKFNHSVITVMEVMGYNGDIEDMENFVRLFSSGNRLNIDDAITTGTIKVRKAVKMNYQTQ